MYKILNDLSAPQLSHSFVKLNDTNKNYNLRNIETDLALPRPYTNFLKRSFKNKGIHADVIVYIFAHLHTTLRTEENL